MIIVKPSFIIVGALKAGTTSIAEWLRSHPDVYLPELKEPRFFLYDKLNAEHRAKSRAIFPIRSLGEYEALFRRTGGFKAVGEASPQYLHSEKALMRMLEVLPDVKVVISLRHPVKRAYSQYWMRVREGVESGSFAEAIVHRHQWTEFSYYADAIERYIRGFGRGRVCIMVFEDLVSAPEMPLMQLCTFLGIDCGATSLSLPRENVGHSGRGGILSKAAYDRRLHLIVKRFLPRPVRRAFRPLLGKGEPMPALEANQAFELSGYFRDDVSRTSDLIGIDLEAFWWPKG